MEPEFIGMAVNAGVIYGMKANGDVYICYMKEAGEPEKSKWTLYTKGPAK